MHKYKNLQRLHRWEQTCELTGWKMLNTPPQVGKENSGPKSSTPLHEEKRGSGQLQASRQPPPLATGYTCSQPETGLQPTLLCSHSNGSSLIAVSQQQATSLLQPVGTTCSQPASNRLRSSSYLTIAVSWQHATTCSQPATGYAVI